MKYIQYLSGITLLLLLTACTKAPDYQGTWKNTLEDPKLENALVITPNGETYFISNTLKDKASGKTEKKNPVPASVNESGLLQVNTGTGAINFAIDEKTGNLVGSGSIYKKVQ
ncbi:hypothetical protein [Acinetobacter pragensis]|uniref:Uncharacterized protein n=1 Tax=Acinetobacter pragensis TaxID=1806892 RepID=A0A151Y2R8_9GAMM|nr:hypothetical protein [Acinetobacter pragensis]KYQ72341.1 hypothetical protein AZH43_10410 [Acinetobacter pragensis]